MPYVSSALSDALSMLGWKQRDLAEKAGIPAPQINRYLHGVNRLPVETLARLVAAFPPQHRGPILVAYVRDCVPPEFMDSVRVEPADDLRLHEATPQPRLLPGIDEELDRMLRLYADLAVRHPEVRQMLKSYLVALRLLPAEEPSVE